MHVGATVAEEGSDDGSGGAGPRVVEEAGLGEEGESESRLDLGN